MSPFWRYLTSEQATNRLVVVGIIPGCAVRHVPARMGPGAESAGQGLRGVGEKEGQKVSYID